jgi:RNA polymerase subunit RPABC4/transcription elongation factor Spt4
LISLLPSGLGFIVYFLLREPIALKCPHCSQAISQDQNFCTQCSFQIKPICTSCRRALDDDDLFCPQCGTATAPSEDRMIANR